VATCGNPVILDEPAAGLEPAQVRDLARVVRLGIGDRRLIVVTSDPAGHRSFVSRAQTRS
jgi:ABC-type branched-subunit amino acid transport system ATPase component